MTVIERILPFRLGGKSKVAEETPSRALWPNRRAKFSSILNGVASRNGGEGYRKLVPLVSKRLRRNSILDFRRALRKDYFLSETWSQEVFFFDFILFPNLRFGIARAVPSILSQFH
jgi:hypothetical protein